MRGAAARRFDYSQDFLKWALQPPGTRGEWVLGVRVAASGRLVGFITAVPARVRVRAAGLAMVEINYLCVHKKLRAKRLAPVLIKARAAPRWRPGPRSSRVPPMLSRPVCPAGVGVRRRRRCGYCCRRSACRHAFHCGGRGGWPQGDASSLIHPLSFAARQLVLALLAVRNPTRGRSPTIGR